MIRMGLREVPTTVVQVMEGPEGCMNMLQLRLQLLEVRVTEIMDKEDNQADMGHMEAPVLRLSIRIMIIVLILNEV